jgi:ABC-type multidrug transport system ATPase subunit
MPERDGLHAAALAVAGAGVVVVRDLELAVPPGGTLAVTGPGGSGLSALLRVLAGLRAPTSGRVFLGGRCVESADGSLRQDIGYVSQDHDLPGALTATENVALALLARGMDAKHSWATAADELAALAVPEAACHNLVEELSGGQQQRVALARALVIRPALLCLDEPFSELDERTAQLVRQRLESERHLGTVLVIATRDQAMLATSQQVLTLPYVPAEPGMRGDEHD